MPPDPNSPTVSCQESCLKTTAKNFVGISGRDLDAFVNMRDLKMVVVATAIAPAGEQGATESQTVTSIRAVIAIGDRASDALDLAYAKVRASSVVRPADNELLDKANLLHIVKAKLEKGIWNFYARQIPEHIIRDLEASTIELEIQAKEMPNATATVNDINKVGAAATSVITAIANAKVSSKPAAPTTNTA
jgi:hypothetical protein